MLISTIILLLYIVLNLFCFIGGFVDGHYYDNGDRRLWKFLFPSYYLGVFIYKLFNIDLN